MSESDSTIRPPTASTFPGADWQDGPESTTGTNVERFNALIFAPLNKILAREGNLALELREWRFNVVTNYKFTQGFLDGFSIGGAIRYQSESAIGYPNSCLDGGSARG